MSTFCSVNYPEDRTQSEKEFPKIGVLMAFFWLQQNDSKIEIPSAEETNGVTYYKIKVYIGDIQWKVDHRYSEFFELHNQLIQEHGISRDLLPSKRVLRNKSPTFIENRRKGLEEYIQKILAFLKKTMPKVFVDFLHFNVYDIYFLLLDLSSKLFLEADEILFSRKPYTFTTLEVHAISEFLKNPLPTVENNENRIDLSPILDFCSQIELIQICGNFGCYKESNIVLNELTFELCSFKNAKTVCLRNIAVNKILSLGSLRSNASILHVNTTKITNICQILQCDVIHKYNLEGSQKWTALEILDLSNNNITEIDTTICLVSNLKELILCNNKISTISNLSSLSNMVYLNLSNNLVTICDELHTKIGNIKSVCLSQNNISSCQGFNKLYSLETLDLSFNKISNIEDIKFVGNLPCLENIVLTGNYLATAVDYRVRVLEYFGDRAKHICLDNEKPSQAELDKVSVFRALRIVKEGKTPDLKGNFSH